MKLRNPSVFLPAICSSVAVILTSCAPESSPEASLPLALAVGQEDQMLASAKNTLEGFENQLGPEATLRLRGNVELDALGRAHLRYVQYHRGVRVWGGELILHATDTHAVFETTDRLLRNVRVSTSPAYSAAQIKAALTDQLKATTSHISRPELIIYSTPDTPRPGTPRLAFYLRVVVLDGHGSPSGQTDFIVDADTAEVIRSWESLETDDIVLTGHSLFSGDVQVSATKESDAVVLRDSTRGGHTLHALEEYNEEGGALYVDTDSDSVVGDSQPFAPSESESEYNAYCELPREGQIELCLSDNGQTAAVDAQYGFQVTWDLLRNRFGRNGPSGDGRAPATYVHNDFWFFTGMQFNAAFSPDCDFDETNGWASCLRFGDVYNSEDSPDVWRGMETLDIVGHELGHELTWTTSQLIYDGESGGLNEGGSDILGMLVEGYEESGKYDAQSATLAKGGDFLVGEDTNAYGEPFRSMIKPSWDRGSSDFFATYLYSHDAWLNNYWFKYANVHKNSGPLNRAFYFLANGAQVSGDGWTPLLPQGSRGIGIDRAAAIWYHAHTTELGSTSNYIDLMEAWKRAAQELFPGDATVSSSVADALRGVNLGEPLLPSATFFETEPNATVSTVETGVPYYATSLTGAFASTSDTDVFRFNLSPSQVISFRSTSTKTVTTRTRLGRTTVVSIEYAGSAFPTFVADNTVAGKVTSVSESKTWVQSGYVYEQTKTTYTAALDLIGSSSAPSSHWISIKTGGGASLAGSYVVNVSLNTTTDVTEWAVPTSGDRSALVNYVLPTVRKFRGRATDAGDFLVVFLDRTANALDVKIESLGSSSGVLTARYSASNGHPAEDLNAGLILDSTISAGGSSVVRLNNYAYGTNTVTPPASYQWGTYYLIELSGNSGDYVIELSAMADRL